MGARRAWALLLSVQARVVRRAEAELASAGLPPLAWYDVLWALEGAGGRLRMRELAERLVLTRSHVTRLADRMEEAGLLRRAPCSEDRRGAFGVLTPAGRRMRRRMWPVYAGVIDAAFAAPLGGREAAALARSLGRIRDTLEDA